MFLTNILVYPLANCLIFLPWQIFPGTFLYVHTPLSTKMYFSAQASGGGEMARLTMAWSFLPFDPQEAFIHIYRECLPFPKEGKYVISWSFTQTRFSPCLILPWLLSSGVQQETKPGYLPCFCYFYFEEKIGSWLWSLTWSPSIPGLRKSKQEASFKCPAWSPHFSCLKKYKQEAICKYLIWSLSPVRKPFVNT